MNGLRTLAEKMLKIPPEPGPPPGDEGTTIVFRASPNYFKYRLVVNGLSQVVGLLVLIAVCSVALLGLLRPEALGSLGNEIFAAIHDAGLERFSSLLIVAIAVVIFMALVRIFFSFIMIWLDYDKRWYVVTDRSLRLRQGVTHVTEMTISFANIQQISISKGPLQRLLGIGDLKVETAGGGGATEGTHPSQNLHLAYFRGVDNADEIRAIMQDRLKNYKDSGLGDADEPPEKEAPHDVNAALRALLAEAQNLKRQMQLATRSEA